MKKTELKIVGFFQGYPSDQSCFVVFREKSGERKVIVRIGLAESDAVLTALENIKPQVPYIHDLFYNLARVVGVKVKEVSIDRADNGNFTAKIIFLHANEEFNIPARICDAIALAVRFDAPVNMADTILDAVKEETQEELSGKDEERKNESHDVAALNDDELKYLMQESLDTENYELAGMIRDELLKRKQPE